MTISENEKLLCEAIASYLQDDAHLGVPEPNHDEESHTFQFLHEQINEMFALKAAGMTHRDGICSAFRKVHNYKYITDPTFHEALRKELSAQAIPTESQDKVTNFIDKIIEDIKKEDGIWNEKDAG